MIDAQATLQTVQHLVAIDRLSKSSDAPDAKPSGRRRKLLKVERRLLIRMRLFQSGNNFSHMR